MCTQLRFLRRLELLQVFLRRGQRLVHTSTTTSANEEQLTPFEKWYGHKPNISHLKVFGCAAYSHVPNTERRKLDEKAQRMCFIGYSKNPKGYRMIDMNTDKIVLRRDVFNETDFRFLKRVNDESVSISPELVDETEDDATECEPQREEPPRRSQRAVRRPEYYGYSGDTTTIELADTATLVEHCAYIVQEVPGTGTFDEVYTGPHEKESEYQSLIDHDTGSLEELPEKQTAVGSKDDHVSKKQEVAALSSSETERAALSLAVLAASLQTLFTDLQIPITIKEDNQRAIAQARNSIGHTRTKHIDIWFCIIRKALAMKEGIIDDIVHCLTSQILFTDLLIKPIPCGQLARELAYSNGAGET